MRPSSPSQLSARARGRLRGTSTDPQARTLGGSLRPPGPIQLEVTEETRPGQTIVRARGEVDVLTAPRLSAPLDAILRGGDDDVVVDLSETTFLDSTGLSVLLNAARRLMHRSRRLQVVCGPGPVRYVIELARLGETLNLADPKPDQASYAS